MKASSSLPGMKIVERPTAVEASLWRRFRFESEAACREMLFQKYHRLARIIARHEYARRPPYGLERGDFEQLAYGGLLEAIDRYDPLRGAPFQAYARHRIRGAISDGLARSSEIAAQYSQRRRIEMERMGSLGSGEAGETTNYIAELADMATLLAIGLVAEDGSAAETGQSWSQPDGYGTLAWREVQLSILQEIDRLPEAERSVMQQHYLNGVEFQHIASLLGLTKGRISQLHRTALKRIRDRLRLSE